MNASLVCQRVRCSLAVGVLFAVVSALWGWGLAQGGPIETSFTTASVPFHRLDDGFQSELVLSNNIDDPREVFVTIFNRDGEAFETPVQLDGHAVKSVPVPALLGRSASRWSRGHVQIRYEGSRYGLGAALKVSQAGARIGYVEEFAVAEDASSTTLAGLLWRPSIDTAQASLVLTNTSERSLKVRIGPQAGRVRPHVVRLTPFSQQEIAVGDLIDADGVPQAVTLTHDGTMGDLMAVGVASDVRTGFSVLVSFSGNGTVQLLRAVGPFLASPAADPAASTHSAVLVGFNLEPRAVSGTGIVRCSSGEEGSFPVEFRPRAGTTIEVAPPPEAEDPRSCSFELELERPVEVVVRLFSLDPTGDLSTEIELKRDRRAGVSNGRYPFDLDVDASEVLIENLSDEPAFFRGGILYAEGVYIFPVQTVEPGRNLLIDLKRLRDEAVPDILGNPLPANLQIGQFYWGQDGESRTLAGSLRAIDLKAGTASVTSCQQCPCWSDNYSELRDGFVPLSGSFASTLKGLINTQKTIQAVTTQKDTCTYSTSTRQVAGQVLNWNYYGTAGAGSVSYGTVSFLQPGGFSIRATFQHIYRFNTPDFGCFQQAQSQPVVTASAKTQKPNSLQVISVSTLPTGTVGDYGCMPSNDWGIKVRITYQVLDQDGEAIKSSSMEPQEIVTGAVYNGVPQGDPVPTWTDIGGPFSRISGVTQYTSSAGRFDDAPFGACASVGFLYSFQQQIGILIGGQHRYFVRGHHIDVTTFSQGHGSINNNYDISKSR